MNPNSATFAEWMLVLGITPIRQIAFTNGQAVPNCHIFDKITKKRVQFRQNLGLTWSYFSAGMRLTSITVMLSSLPFARASDTSVIQISFALNPGLTTISLILSSLT